MKYSFFVRDLVSTDDMPQIKRGDYVSFDVEHPSKPGIYIREFKKVRCSAGDTLTVSGREYFCNKAYLGRSKSSDSAGRPVTPYSKSGMLAPGQIFVMGDHRDSYDSRYYGPIQVTNIKEKLWPIF